MNLLKTFGVIVLSIFATENLSSQDDIKWKLQDTVKYGIEELIDSIWMEVVGWDDDTSNIAEYKREKQASDLENYSIKTKLKAGEKASKFSYLIRLRNHDYDRVIRNFEASEFDLGMFKNVYSSYSSALQAKYEGAVAESRLDSLANELTCSDCKIIIWSDLGRTLFYRKNQSSAKEYFQKVVTLSEEYELIDTIDIRRARSFIRKIDHLNVGDSMLPFQTEDIYGNEVTISKEDKKVTLIDFWATWCRPCIKNLPVLKRIFEKYRTDQDFRMIGISLDKELGKLVEYIDKESILWPQIYEQVSDGITRDGDIVNLYNGYGLPTYYLIDKGGIIRFNFESGREGIDLEEMVDRLMKE